MMTTPIVNNPTESSTSSAETENSTPQWTLELESAALLASCNTYIQEPQNFKKNICIIRF